MRASCKLWVVVPNGRLSSGLGVGTEDTLVGTCFISAFLSREMAVEYVKRSQKWRGLKIITTRLLPDPPKEER